MAKAAMPASTMQDDRNRMTHPPCIVNEDAQHKRSGRSAPFFERLHYGDYGQCVYRSTIVGRMPDTRPPAAFLPLAEDAVLILLALASRPLHGYGIIRDIEERSSGESVLQTGALYRMLRRLLRDALIEECAA